MLKVRVDDFPLTKPEESWRHNLDNFKKFHEIFQKLEVPYVLGVIPRHVTGEQLKYLSGERKLIEVALHGINHDERFPNEFREYQTEQDRYNAILAAKVALEAFLGYEINKYIPPHNVVDITTLIALNRVGFRDVLTGPGLNMVILKGWGFEEEEKNLKLHYSSPDSLLYGRSDELLTAGCPEKIKTYSSDYDYYLSLHWTWEMNIGLTSLEELLRKVFKE